MSLTLCSASCQHVCLPKTLKDALPQVRPGGWQRPTAAVLQVTEAEVAQHFADCGQIMDCRVCGDPNSAMRFAFIEFRDEASLMQVLQLALLRCNSHVMDSCLGSAVWCVYAVLRRKRLAVSGAADAMQALKLNGSLLGCHRLRVTPSKTAIVPVKSDFLPRTDLERALCARTVYVANIDKKVDKEDVLAYFEKFCGEGCRLAVSDYSSVLKSVSVKPLGIVHVSHAHLNSTSYGRQVPNSHCRHCHTASSMAEVLRNSQDL